MSVLFAALLLWSQSAQTDASAQAQPPVQDEQAAPAQDTVPGEEAAPTEAPAAQQQATTEAAAATEVAEPPEEEVICRRKLVEGNGFGQRNIAKKVCKTRAEWSQRSRRRD